MSIGVVDWRSCETPGDKGMNVCLISRYWDMYDKYRCSWQICWQYLSLSEFNRKVTVFIIDNSLLIIVSLFCIMLLSVLIKQYCLLIVSPFTSFSLGGMKVLCRVVWSWEIDQNLDDMSHLTALCQHNCNNLPPPPPPHTHTYWQKADKWCSKCTFWQDLSPWAGDKSCDNMAIFFKWPRINHWSLICAACCHVALVLAVVEFYCFLVVVIS